jgi:hypothetical protein
VTSVGRFLRLPPIPDIPELLRGKSFVVVEATSLLDEADSNELLRPLRDLGPAIDTFATIPVQELKHLHMDPEHPVPGAGDGMLLADFDDEGVDALVRSAGPGVESPLLSVEVRHLGGALARSDERHGAVATMRGGYALFAVGVPMTPELGAAIHAQLPKLMGALEPWQANAAYLNFAEQPVDPARFYSPEDYARLRRVKSEVDPTHLFRGNHAISGV